MTRKHHSLFKGITLTAADHIIFSELHWTPGVMEQAEDRVHRIGQENSVLVQYLVARGTIDEVLWRMLCNKVEVVNFTKNPLLGVSSVTLTAQTMMKICLSLGKYKFHLSCSK